MLAAFDEATRTRINRLSRGGQLFESEGRTAMIGLYALAVFFLAIAFIFTNGVIFALSFLGTAMIPCVAVAALKWGILLRGDPLQRIGMPAGAILALAFAYWLSTGVSIQFFGFTLSGLALAVIGGLFGLSIPLSSGRSKSPTSN